MALSRPSESGLRIDDDDGDDDLDAEEDADSLLPSSLQSPSDFPSFLSEGSQIEYSQDYAHLYALLHQSQKSSCGYSPRDGSSASESRTLEFGRCNPIVDASSRTQFQVSYERRQSIDDRFRADASNGDSPERTLAPDDGSVQDSITTDVPPYGVMEPSNQLSISSPYRCVQQLHMSPPSTENACMVYNRTEEINRRNPTDIQKHGLHLQDNHPKVLETKPSRPAVKAQVKDVSVMIRETQGKENLQLGEERRKRVADGNWMCPRDSKRNFKAKPHQVLLDKWLVKQR